MSNKFLKFPTDFLWGGASAPEQYEGHGQTGKGLTVWDKFYQTDPEAFWDKVGPNITSDFFNKYNEDLELFKSFGINSLRIGISWARIIPDGQNVSKAGIQFYKDVIAKCKALEIKLVLNLFHFDMPLWAHEKGSFESKEVIDAFVQYADIVFKEFGNDVDYISTFNEPGVPVFAGYQGANHWPRVKDNKRAVQMGYGIILAHAKTVKLYREKYSNCQAKIGVVINVNPPIVKDGINYTKADEEAAWIFNLLHNNIWLYGMVKGEWPEGAIAFIKKYNVLPEHTTEELAIINNVKIDFLGTNFYAPTRIQAPEKIDQSPLLWDLFQHFHYDKARYNVFRGWEIKPEAMYDLAMIIKNDFDNIPFYISENGMGVENENNFRNSSGMIQDEYRIAFLQEHLEQLHKAMSEGANCFGYHMWCIADNWSWRNAYKNRYGFVEINLEDQSRKLKQSALWFKDMILNNGFETGFPKIEDKINLAQAKFTKSV